MSTILDDDTRRAHDRLRRKARALGAISSAFAAPAAAVSAAYLAALTQRSCTAWTALVTRTAELVQVARTLRDIVDFDAQEREAAEFFEAILRENSDLLVVPAAGAWGTRNVTAFVQAP